MCSTLCYQLKAKFNFIDDFFKFVDFLEKR